MLASGSPTILRVMRNLSGSSANTGRIFFATGLYFFPANMLRGWDCDDRENREARGVSGDDLDSEGGRSQAER